MNIYGLNGEFIANVSEKQLHAKFDDNNKRIRIARGGDDSYNVVLRSRNSDHRITDEVVLFSTKDRIEAHKVCSMASNELTIEGNNVYLNEIINKIKEQEKEGEKQIMDNNEIELYDYFDDEAIGKIEEHLAKLDENVQDAYIAALKQITDYSKEIPGDSKISYDGHNFSKDNAIFTRFEGFVNNCPMLSVYSEPITKENLDKAESISTPPNAENDIEGLSYEEAKDMIAKLYAENRELQQKAKELGEPEDIKNQIDKNNQFIKQLADHAIVQKKEEKQNVYDKIHATIDIKIASCKNYFEKIKGATQKVINEVQMTGKGNWAKLQVEAERIYRNTLSEQYRANLIAIKQIESKEKIHETLHQGKNAIGNLGRAFSNFKNTLTGQELSATQIDFNYNKLSQKRINTLADMKAYLIAENDKLQQEYNKSLDKDLTRIQLIQAERQNKGLDTSKGLDAVIKQVTNEKITDYHHDPLEMRHVAIAKNNAHDFAKKNNNPSKDDGAR